MIGFAGRAVGLALVLGLLVVGLVFAAAPVASAQTAQEIEVRDRLIADQEALLDVYRCMFDIDTQVVSGGCADGEPVMPPLDPGQFSGIPTAQDIAIRDQLIADQEALLNVYRCMFSIDTELVPGGCPEPEVEEEVDPPKETTNPCQYLTDASDVTIGNMAAASVIISFGTLQFCCPNNAMYMDHNGRCFGDEGYESPHLYFFGCAGGWVEDTNLLCPGDAGYGSVKCATGAIKLIYGICPDSHVYVYGYYGYGYGLEFQENLPWLKCAGGVIMDAYGRCPGDEFYYGEQQCPDGGSVIDYYGRCPSDSDYGMGWKE